MNFKKFLEAIVQAASDFYVLLWLTSVEIYARLGGMPGVVKWD